MQGIREAYAHLMHCADKPILVSAEDYRSHAFMYGFNLQKIESASYTGMNLTKFKYGCSSRGDEELNVIH